MLRKRLREILIRGALRARGYSDQEIDEVFKKIETDTGRPILDWLVDGGFMQILQAILAILALFGATKPDPTLPTSDAGAQISGDFRAAAQDEENHSVGTVQMPSPKGWSGPEQMPSPKGWSGPERSVALPLPPAEPAGTMVLTINVTPFQLKALISSLGLPANLPGQ